MASVLPPSTVTVTLDNRTIVGKAQPPSEFYSKPLDTFYGIRYAEASRFKAPVSVPLRSLSGEVDATKPSPPCPVPMSPQDTSEDSLRVNITRPSGRGGGKKMPVVVYLHGGGFNFGNPLDGNVAAFVARSERDMLGVSVGYRLGALGFGPGEEGDDADSNLGVRDQRLAVEWLRESIGVFGGDGEDITLMGVSAGAHSIGHHMLNPNPLACSKAILESGSPTARSVLSISHPRTKSQFTSFRRHLPGQKETRTVDDILHSSLKIWAENMDSLAWPFQPVVDGGPVIPDLPLKLWKQPRPLPLPPILTGFCSDEGADFMPTRPPPFRDFFAALIPALDLDALEAVYPDPGPGAGHTQKLRRLYEAYGHYAYICPVLHTAHMASRAGARVYLYEYAGFNADNDDEEEGEGEGKTSGHCAQSPMVRPEEEELRGHPGLEAISAEMHKRWTAFVAAPGGELGRDVWPVFETPFVGGGGGGGELLVFGEGNDEMCGGREEGVAVGRRRVTEREMEVCRFWWDRVELSQGMGVKGVVGEAW